VEPSLTALTSGMMGRLEEEENNETGLPPPELDLSHLLPPGVGELLDRLSGLGIFEGKEEKMSGRRWKIIHAAVIGLIVAVMVKITRERQSEEEVVPVFWWLMLAEVLMQSTQYIIKHRGRGVTGHRSTPSGASDASTLSTMGVRGGGGGGMGMAMNVLAVLTQYRTIWSMLIADISVLVFSIWWMMVWGEL